MKGRGKKIGTYLVSWYASEFSEFVLEVSHTPLPCNCELVLHKRVCVCVCVCARACVCACVCTCMCACVHGEGGTQIIKYTCAYSVPSCPSPGRSLRLSQL